MRYDSISSENIRIMLPTLSTMASDEKVGIMTHFWFYYKSRTWIMWMRGCLTDHMNSEADLGLALLINSLWPSDAIWQQIWVNTGSGNGLLPGGTKPLPELMLTDHQSSDIHIRAISQKMPGLSAIKIRLKITHLKFHSNFPGANELTLS